mgnify:CR=1 FL=1
MRKIAEYCNLSEDCSLYDKTGDNSNLMLWIALLFISGGVTIGTTVIAKKKKHNI